MKGRTKAKLGYVYFVLAFAAVYYAFGFTVSGEVSWHQFFTGSAVLAGIFGITAIVLGGIYIIENIDDWKREG